MSLEIKVPTVGESITEVTIAQWLKKDGEIVEMDEVLCELESDKATFELNAEAAGKLTIKVQEGETVEIGAVICEIDENAKSDKKPAADKTESAKASATPPKEGKSSSGPVKTGKVKEMVVPTVGESITEVTISSWIKSDGDYVALDEVIAEVDSDKATFELPAEASGFLSIVASEGTTLKIGDTICKIEVAEGAPAGKTDAPAQSPGKDVPVAETSKSAGYYAESHPSPAAAKILAEKGIKPEEVKGSGVDGRITKADAEKATPKKQAPQKDTTPSSAPKTAFSRNSTRKKMSNLRKTIARRLVAVKNETAMLTTFNEVDMKPVMSIRSKYKEQFKEKHGVGLGFMSFFTKACCVALQEWPAVNAQIDGYELVYNDFCDVSIAVSTPRGLVVPVVRNAESMTFAEIEQEILNLATKARDSKLTIEEMTGGTFTITNGGVFGSMLSTPIINAPQSAILGMHNIVERPMALNGEVVIRPIMYLALSYDHRIVDGRESVSFLVRVKQLLEDPSRLLLEV